MTPETMVTAWLPVWLHGAGLELVPAPDWSDWVSELHERAWLEHRDLAARYGPTLMEPLHLLVHETVPIIVASLPPTAREWIRRQNQGALDAVRAAINVWALDAADVLTHPNGDVAQWRARRTATAAVAAQITDANSAHIAVLRPHRRTSLG